MDIITQIFEDDDFSVASLSTAMQDAPFVRSRLAEMGIFQQEPITGIWVAIEEEKGLLSLLPAKERGEQGSRSHGPKRNIRGVKAIHIPHTAEILADALLGVRMPGTNQLAGPAALVNSRIVQMRQCHEVTHEYERIGAITGIILDADGSTELLNLFDTFGVDEHEVDFALDVATTDVRKKCLAVKRWIQKTLGALPMNHVHALCGADWFDAFIGHEYVKDAYHRYQDSAMLRNDPRSGFEFAGIIFEEYPGAVGEIDFVNASVARFFPVGTPGLFMHYMAPADYMETVNQPGQEVYAKIERMEFDKGVKVETQSNPLIICRKPAVLVKGS
jgi:hypothetical protein